jgi:hypothetical protein
MPKILWRHGAWLSVLSLCGCASGDAARAQISQPSQRIVVTTVRELPGIAQVTDHAAKLSGVPVRDTVEIGPGLYRMTLLCADYDACKAAMSRIAADRSFVLGVDADGRVQIPSKPSRDMSR